MRTGYFTGCVLVLAALATSCDNALYTLSNKFVPILSYPILSYPNIFCAFSGYEAKQSVDQRTGNSEDRRLRLGQVLWFAVARAHTPGRDEVGVVIHC